MSFKLQAAMASGLRDEIKPRRRFDLTMSRRTRKPSAAATLATSCQEQDRHHQAVDVQGLGFEPVVQLERQDPDGFSDHLQSRQPEDQASPPRTCRLEKEDDESEAQQHHQQEEEEYQDNSRRFSLQELIQDEAVDDGVKDAATGGMHMEENAAAGGRGVEVAEPEGDAVAGAEKRPGQQVAGRKVIGMMRRYVKVRSIKPKRASPEKNATPVC